MSERACAKRRKRLPTLEEFERRSLYGRVGVARDASPVRIARAYRKRAARFHPDRAGHTPEANQRFSILTDAKNLLLDPVRRAAYDRTLSPALPINAPNVVSNTSVVTDDELARLRELLERFRAEEAPRTSMQAVLDRMRADAQARIWTELVGRTPDHVRHGDAATFGLDLLGAVLGSVLLK